MYASWQKNNAHGISDFYVIDTKHSAGGTFFSSLGSLPGDVKPDVIVFAVKPQQLADILPLYKERFGTAPLYISIAAGKTLEFFIGHLGEGAKIIRAMPNTPALVGKAVTALCATPNISELQKNQATALMESFGKAIWVAEENMDAVTALSGSGPAYVFLFLEALTQAGINAGIDAETAKLLALEMTHGSIHLASKGSDDFAELRRKVTSKGGTTEAALQILMAENALGGLIDSAIQAAIKRAKSLAG